MYVYMDVLYVYMDFCMYTWTCACVACYTHLFDYFLYYHLRGEWVLSNIHVLGLCCIYNAENSTIGDVVGA